MLVLVNGPQTAALGFFWMGKGKYVSKCGDYFPAPAMGMVDVLLGLFQVQESLLGPTNPT